MTYYQQHLFLCTHQKVPGKQCCANSGGDQFFDYMKTKLQELGLHGPGKIRITKSGCLGRCGSGPCLLIYPEGLWYTYHSFQDIDTIIQKVLIDHQVVEDLLIDATA